MKSVGCDPVSGCPEDVHQILYFLKSMALVASLWSATWTSLVQAEIPIHTESGCPKILILDSSDYGPNSLMVRVSYLTGEGQVTALLNSDTDNDWVLLETVDGTTQQSASRKVTEQESTQPELLIQHIDVRPTADGSAIKKTVLADVGMLPNKAGGVVLRTPQSPATYLVVWDRTQIVCEAIEPLNPLTGVANLVVTGVFTLLDMERTIASLKETQTGLEESIDETRSELELAKKDLTQCAEGNTLVLKTLKEERTLIEQLRGERQIAVNVSNACYQELEAAQKTTKKLRKSLKSPSYSKKSVKSLLGSFVKLFRKIRNKGEEILNNALGNS